MVAIAAVDEQGSESTVLSEGERLARVFGELLHAVCMTDLSRFRRLEQTGVDELGRTVELQAVREMAEGVANESAATVATDSTTVGPVGELAEEALKYADCANESHIGIGGRNRSEVGEALFGSVTRSIFPSTESPVLTAVSDNE